MLAQKNAGPGPLVYSELLKLIFSNLKIKDILYSCLTVNRQWSFEAFRVILKQKERELREDLDFIKYRLDCSKQEITRIHTVLYTPYYNWIIAGEEIANVYAIIKSHIDNLTNTYKMRNGIDTKALAYAQRREGRCLAKGVDPADNAGGPPTGREELRDMMYGTIRKGNMSIDELYRKILRIGRRANYRPEELRRKFLDALPLPWLEKAEDIGEHLLLDELAKKLYEIELR
ncbi:19196_t:CDS:2 [Gigaspora margarita]|uniref:19196_t:CDS:1 n=1 Tax=Gigaspora margarita TaxID=4874 RepID=A0ABN7VGV8_GIGMA|nr:19196_t:CDS:2 [Gigaspora margarita]